MARKKQSQFVSRFGEIQKNTEIKKYIFGTLYYTLNLVTFLSALYVAIIAVYFLAGNNKNYPGDVNPYRLEFWKDSSNYILTTTIINSITSMISSFIAFFAINSKFEYYKKKSNLLKFEYILFINKKWIYNSNNSSDNEFILFKRGLSILETNRYKSSAFLNYNEYKK
ncbi:hypothetical protein MCANPG14_00783 [Mycoplasmopsis canis PG 14]|uniref:DUF4231 domain-containing protein n=1 Tax=Mycoplasmopsis canis TaxID=29555 RepID=A0A449AQ22_9BACT|nr:DUF4231 domain-containing protein [Mycoplasmopsis canis]AMD81357.1 hypothetical protein AXW82_02235 [Mycoplasmopsis canis PG 14]EIE40499.1 hypothetical protein MCANPG14_00783 [Mycoplasmopsis canis PG 14]VEU68665.1 Uncharacterised protein [Mycoplasmopsis canis]